MRAAFRACASVVELLVGPPTATLGSSKILPRRRIAAPLSLSPTRRLRASWRATRSVTRARGERAMGDRPAVPFLSAVLAIALALASCAGESADGDLFQDPGDAPNNSANPGKGGGSSSEPRDPVGGSSSVTPRSSQEDGPSGCCRTCSQGKACGNSCISRQLTCRVGSGCACDG